MTSEEIIRRLREIGSDLADGLASLLMSLPADKIPHQYLRALESTRDLLDKLEAK